MDFDFSAEEQEFRKELAEFLEEELPPWWRGRYNDDPEAWKVVLGISPKMAERGWLTMHWPKEYGGREASVWEQVVLKEVMAESAEPRGPQYMAANWIGPSIMLFGTEEQKKQHLLPISEGHSFWAQGFSEPDAGSDLASLKTRALRDGDEYVINGEKIWTSHLPHADYIYLLTRSDPDAPKHKGISVFLVPKEWPGIRIVPIESMEGTFSEFAHVYFEDCRVPASMRLGPENEGWRVVVRALEFERTGVPWWKTARHRLEALRDYACQAGVDGRRLYDDPIVRQRFSELSNQVEVGKLLYYRQVSEVAKGDPDPLTVPLQRMASTLAGKHVALFAQELLGSLGELEEQHEEFAPVRGMAPEWWRVSIVATIAAGTTEMNKNIAATRGLGLPRG